METRSEPQILMCPPDYYGIEYEINPWMNIRAGSDPHGARRQWTALYDSVCALGVAVDLKFETVLGEVRDEIAFAVMDDHWERYLTGVCGLRGRRSRLRGDARRPKRQRCT